MTSTKLFRELVISASALQREYEMEEQFSAFYILAAMKFCKREYLGFSEVEEQQPLPYEEERLRYLLEKVFLRRPGAGGRFMEFVLKRDKCNLAPSCTRDELLGKVAVLAEQRKIPVISADLMLAVALEGLNPQFDKLLLPECREGKISAAELIRTADREIYDYVINEISALTEKLRQKAEGARALRDWRPALAFAPAEELEEKLRASIAMAEREGYLHLTYPYFFADTGNPLRLTVWETEQGYVIHDNGCAIAELKAHLRGGDWQNIALRICAGTICRIEGESVTAFVSASHYIERFLQYISLIAHADLYPNYDPRGNTYEALEEYLSIPPKESPNYSEMREGLTRYLQVAYDEYQGIRMGLGLFYLGNSTGAGYLLTTDEDGQVTIHDYSNSYNEGAIFESYLCYNDDLTQCQAQIEVLAHRFGGYCDGKEVICTFRNDSEDAFVRAVNRYVQMAVILSQIGHYIPLESENNRG